ncbi:MAG: DUF3276 family protein [Chitinophagaceae bacterium]|nr:MAG: DUF3276 family protein [Chitinophagaceae bacterium]
MDNDNSFKKNDSVYSKVVRAGKRRTYFLDVKTTRSNDYFLTITESKKRFNGDGYDRHKVFLYKEDFNKFVEALNDVVNHVKTELLPEYDFDEFNHENDDFNNERSSSDDAGNHNQENPHKDESEEDMKWD